MVIESKDTYVTICLVLVVVTVIFHVKIVQTLDFLQFMYLYDLICFCKQLTRYLEIFHYYVVSLGLIHIHELVCRVYGSLQYCKFFKVDRNNLSSLSTFLISAGTFIIYFLYKNTPLMKMELAVRGFGLFVYFELFTRGISSFLDHSFFFYHRRSQQFILYILEIPIPVRSNPSLLWF